MEVEYNTAITSKNTEDDDDDVALPGFRFHPTDEELVGFYLRRKVEKRPISIELIKQADIYKYDPWDLPKSSNVGDKEWYFFCKRGRKYRNSIRPNRVTGSGFWKATGIDKPIYSSGGEGRHCIGLKKSLVYYRGSAGKGTKTDWMMHEFRLPTTDKSIKDMDAKTIALEAEVWTLCRILKRDVSYKKCVPDWREAAAKKSITNRELDASSKSCLTDSSDQTMQSSYISFSAPIIKQNDHKEPYFGHVENITNQQFQGHFNTSIVQPHQASICASLVSTSRGADINELLRNAEWEDLQAIVDHAAAAASTNAYYF